MQGDGKSGIASLSMSQMTLLLLLSLISMMLSGCIDDTGGMDWSDGDDEDGFESWGILVVNTDFHSTSISVLDRVTQRLFREGIIDSGSSAPGLSIALSGDVILPANPLPDNRIVLIDRYPNAVLTFLEPDDFSVSGQLSVATGFASNPHDFLWLEDHKAYVTRYESNPSPGSERYDGGGDILIVDPLELEILGRIGLDEYIETGGEDDFKPHPWRMQPAAGLVWLVLGNYAGDYDTAGDSVLLAIDPQTDEVVKSLELTGMLDCNGLTYDEERTSLYISCSGLFRSQYEQNLDASAILSVDISRAELGFELIRRATEGSGRPFGFDIDLLRSGTLLAIRFGSLDAENPDDSLPDSLVAIDRETGKERRVHQASTAFGMGGLLVDDATATIYVGDADPEDPAVYLYREKNAAFEAIKRIEAAPESGLPPRHIQVY